MAQPAAGGGNGEDRAGDDGSAAGQGGRRRGARQGAHPRLEGHVRGRPRRLHGSRGRTQ